MGTQILLLDTADPPDAGLPLQLRQCGFTVETAAELDTAVRLQRDGARTPTVVRVARAGSAELLCALPKLATTPIVIICSESEADLVVPCLEAGADTVLVAPVSRRELAGRIRAALNWCSGSLQSGEGRRPQPYQVGNLTIDPDRHKVTNGGHEVALTPTEFRLLAALARRAGETVNHADLVSEVWGAVCAGTRRSLRLYIRYLRRKLAHHHGQRTLIHNDRGVGYRLTAETT